MPDIKISVITPVYNKAVTLPQCLDSIIKQSITELEVICVDDGSTDNSGAILEEYVKKDGRISVISQNNRGAGAARNEALQRVRGRYVAFLDADDYFADYLALEKLYKSAVYNEALICGGSIEFVQDDRVVPSVLEDIDYSFTTEGWAEYTDFQQDY